MTKTKQNQLDKLDRKLDELWKEMHPNDLSWSFFNSSEKLVSAYIDNMWNKDFLPKLWAFQDDHLPGCDNIEDQITSIAKWLFAYWIHNYLEKSFFDYVISKQDYSTPEKKQGYDMFAMCKCFFQLIVDPEYRIFHKDEYKKAKKLMDGFLQMAELGVGFSIRFNEAKLIEDQFNNKYPNLSTFLKLFNKYPEHQLQIFCRVAQYILEKAEEYERIWSLKTEFLEKQKEFDKLHKSDKKGGRPKTLKNLMVYHTSKKIVELFGKEIGVTSKGKSEAIKSLLMVFDIDFDGDYTDTLQNKTYELYYEAMIFIDPEAYILYPPNLKKFLLVDIEWVLYNCDKKDFKEIMKKWMNGTGHPWNYEEKYSK